MGSICSTESSVTDINGKNKNEIKGASYTDGKDVANMLNKADAMEKSKFATMNSVHNTIMKILKNDLKQEIIVLTIPMKHFADFVANLSAMITLIHT